MPTTGDEFTTPKGVKCTLGERITDLPQLEAAARDKRAVITPGSWAWNNPRPAIFMFNQIGHYLLQCFRAGMFIYIKQPKTKKTKSPS